MWRKPLLCTIFFAILAGIDLSVLASGSTRSSLDQGHSYLNPTPLSASSQVSPSTTSEDLFEETDKTQDDRRLYSLVIAQNPDHPHQLDAIYALWHCGDDQQNQNRKMLRPNLLPIADNHEHPKQILAINLLWNSADAQQTENRTALYPTLRQIAQNFWHPEQWRIAYLLWNIEGDQQIQERHDLLPGLLKLQPIIRILWNTPDIDIAQAKNRAALRPLLNQIANNPHLWRQYDAIKYLQKSEDPADKTLGLKLHQQYFSGPRSRSAFKMIQKQDKDKYKSFYPCVQDILIPTYRSTTAF